MSDMSGVSALWAAIALWAGHKHGGRLDTVPGCWTSDFTFEGMPVGVFFNAHTEDCQADVSGAPLTVAPFNALLVINGWPALLVGPRGGTLMGGEPGSEDRLIAAFEAATPKTDPVSA